MWEGEMWEMNCGKGGAICMISIHALCAVLELDCKISVANPGHATGLHGTYRESNMDYYKTRKVLLVLDATGEPSELPNARCETGPSWPRTRLTM